MHSTGELQRLERPAEVVLRELFPDNDQTPERGEPCWIPSEDHWQENVAPEWRAAFLKGSPEEARESLERAWIEQMARVEALEQRLDQLASPQTDSTHASTQSLHSVCVSPGMFQRRITTPLRRASPPALDSRRVRESKDEESSEWLALSPARNLDLDLVPVTRGGAVGYLMRLGLLVLAAIFGAAIATGFTTSNADTQVRVRAAESASGGSAADLLACLGDPEGAKRKVDAYSRLVTEQQSLLETMEAHVSRLTVDLRLLEQQVTGTYWTPLERQLGGFDPLADYRVDLGNATLEAALVINPDWIQFPTGRLRRKTMTLKRTQDGVVMMPQEVFARASPLRLHHRED